jgi:hypothetical protein
VTLSSGKLQLIGSVFVGVGLACYTAAGYRLRKEEEARADTWADATEPSANGTKQATSVTVETPEG